MNAAALRADPAGYTPCYCEENVANVARALLSSGSGSYDELLVAFISNPAKACPIWHQRASATAAGEPVVWDYHVVLLGRRREGARYDVLDLDSSLPFPAPAREYCAAAFRPHEPLRPAYRQRFRVLPAAEYLRVFASDRRHMRRGDGGGWAAPPPAYPPLRGPDAGCDWNLGAFWDVSGGDVGRAVGGGGGGGGSADHDGDAGAAVPFVAPGDVLSLSQFMQRYCTGNGDKG